MAANDSKPNALWAAFQKVSAGRWSCPGCGCLVKDTDLKCPSCLMDKPGQTSSAEGAAKPPADAGGLFGSSTKESSGGLFGSAPASDTGGLFGTCDTSKPPTFNKGGLFGGDKNDGDEKAEKSDKPMAPPTFNFGNVFAKPKEGDDKDAKPAAPVFSLQTTNKKPDFGNLFGGPSSKPPQHPKKTMLTGKSAASPFVKGFGSGRGAATPSMLLSKQLGTFGLESPANPSQGSEDSLMISSQNPAPDAEAAKKVLKNLEPHRNLPIGSTILLTCGFGGFAQLGLGEEASEDEDADEDMSQLKGGENTSAVAKTDVDMDEECVLASQKPEPSKESSTASNDKKHPRDFTSALDNIPEETRDGLPKTDKEGPPPRKRKRGNPEDALPPTKPWPAPCVSEAQVPTRVPNLDGLKLATIEMGVMGGACITEEGKTFVWGGNDHCNLGFSGDDAWVPKDISDLFPNGTKMKKVTCGSSHTVFLTTEGQVYTAGTFKNDGWEGAFYDPETKTTLKRLEKPTRLEYVASSNTKGNERQRLPAIVDIASGLDHMLMVDVDGNLWEMGVTLLGQRSSSRNQHLYLQPRRVGLKQRSVKFSAVRCGSHFNIAVSRDKDLFTWGQNNYMQCGHPLRTKQANPKLIDMPAKVDFKNPSVKVQDVGGGVHYTVVLDTSGRVWTFGRNGSFELGRDTVIPPRETIAGEVQKFDNEPKPGFPEQVKSLEKQIVQIGVGANHWFAVAADSTTYAVGANLEFRTGVNLDEGASRFVKVYHAGNLRQDFMVCDVSAGYNTSGFLLKRVGRRRERKAKRELSFTPARRTRRKIALPPAGDAAPGSTKAKLKTRKSSKPK